MPFIYLICFVLNDTTHERLLVKIHIIYHTSHIDRYALFLYYNLWKPYKIGEQVARSPFYEWCTCQGHISSGWMQVPDDGES